MSRVRAWSALVLPAAVVVVVTGCSSTGSGGSSAPPSTSVSVSRPAPTTSTTTSRRTVTTATSSTVAVSATQVSGRPALCSAANVRVAATYLTPASGSFGVAIRLTNTGRTPCSTYGYPGVAVLDASGHQQFQARRTLRGYFGGESGRSPRTVVLSRGQTATALLEGSNRSEPSGDPCPADHAILVTPPDTERSVRRSVTVYACTAPQVHPFVRGTTGDD